MALGYTRAEWIDKITSFIVVNMLWVVFASFIVALPAATAGLFVTLMPWVRGKSSEPFRDFLGGMRQYWRKATVIVLVDAGIGVLTVFNLTVLSSMEQITIPALFSRSIVLLVAVLVLLTNVYLWPLLVTIDLPLRKLIELALRLIFLHPVWSLFVGMLTLIPLLLTLVLPRFVAIIFPFSASALLASWGVQHVMEQHQS